MRVVRPDIGALARYPSRKPECRGSHRPRHPLPQQGAIRAIAHIFGDPFGVAGRGCAGAGFARRPHAIYMFEIFDDWDANFPFLVFVMLGHNAQY